MFGWRKKRDGFEWHEYVRTTILLRRANRRRKVDEVRDAAIDGLKHGIKGAQRAAAAGLDSAKAAAAAGLREAADKGSVAGAKGLSSAGSAVSATARSIARGISRLASTIAGAPGRAWRAAPSIAVLPTILQGSRAAGWSSRFAAWFAGTRLGARELTVPMGATGVALAIAAVTRGVRQGFDATTLVIGLAAAVALLLAALPALAREDGPRDAAIRQRGGRPSRSDYQDSDDITYPRARLAQARAMLAWGGIAAALVLGIGPLLTGETSSPAEPAGIVTSSISRSDAASGPLAGSASILSGDTLRISGRIVQLAGIEVPEASQSCVRDSGTRWPCGAAARRALEQLARREKLSCETVENRSTAPPLVRCRTGAGSDIAAEMVRAGHAFAEQAFFASYGSEEQQARGAKAGIWSGTPQRPADYRAARWDEAKKTAPEGCPIKGRISGRERTYVLPWSDDYNRVKIRDGRGRWFCSEDEARAAGWTPSHRRS